MDTPENIETLQYMVDMQQKTNVMPTEEQMAGMGDWDLFESGRLGMIVTGIWAFPEYTSNCDFDWDIVVEPGHTQKATHFFSNGYVISKDSQVADEAVKFITYISSKGPRGRNWSRNRSNSPFLLTARGFSTQQEAVYLQSKGFAYERYYFRFRWCSVPYR